MQRRIFSILPFLSLLPFATAIADTGEADSPRTEAFNVAPATSDADIPSVAGNPAGDIVIAWDGADEAMSGVKAAHFAQDGNQAGDVIDVNVTSYQNEYYGDVAMSPDGSFVVTWMSTDADGAEFSAFARRFAADGTSIGEEIAVPTFGSESQWMPQVAVTPQGAFVVAWEGNDGIYAQFYDANGAAIDGVTEVAAPETFAQDVTVSAGFDETYTLAWEDTTSDGDGSFGIRMRRFAASGEPISDAVTVNVTTTELQMDPSVATAPNGESVVTWTDNNRVAMRVFDSLGAPLGGEIEVSEKGGATTVAALPAGGYVVGFTRLDKSNVRTLFARRYSASGVAEGDAYRVSPEGEAVSDYYPDVTATANGNAAFAWNNGEYIRGRIMNGAGLDLVLKGDVNKDRLYSNREALFDLEAYNETATINTAVADVNSAHGVAGNYSLHVHLPAGASLESYSGNWYCTVQASDLVNCTGASNLGRGEKNALSINFKFEGNGKNTTVFDLVSEDTGDKSPADNSVSFDVEFAKPDGDGGGAGGGGGSIGWLLFALPLCLARRRALTRAS